MKTFKYLLVSVLLLGLSTSCGKKEEKKKSGFTYEEKAGETSKKEVAPNPNDVLITSNDAMQFNTKSIKVKANAKVKITLKHVGKLDKNVMGHNFVLLKQGTDLVAFGNKAASARATEYIPEDMKDAVIAHTKLIAGGETAVVEFDAPTAGEYEFLCSFPGHYSMMRGIFIVE